MQTIVHNFKMEGVWNNKQIIKYTKKRLIYINSLNIHHNFGRNKMWLKIQDANKAETSKRVSNLSSAQLQRKGKLKCGGTLGLCKCVLFRQDHKSTATGQRSLCKQNGKVIESNYSFHLTPGRIHYSFGRERNPSQVFKRMKTNIFLTKSICCKLNKLGKYVSHSNPIHGLMSLDTKKVQYGEKHIKNQKTEI